MGTGCIRWCLKGKGSNSLGAVGSGSLLRLCCPPLPRRDLGHVLSSLWASTSLLQSPWLAPPVLDLYTWGALRLGPGSSLLSTTLSLGGPFVYG